MRAHCSRERRSLSPACGQSVEKDVEKGVEEEGEGWVDWREEGWCSAVFLLEEVFICNLQLNYFIRVLLLDVLPAETGGSR
jgi:hypothetical protein